MELQTPVSGGVGILHRVKDGKHHYEVDTVFNENRQFFTRQGDQLLKINDLDMQDLTPREFAELLSSGNPMLRIHHAGVEHPKKAPEKTGDFWSVFKEDTVLTFSMDMAVEPDLQGESDGCDQDELEVGLLVELLGPCVEMVLGRGGGHGESCQDCVVVMSKAARVEAVLPCFKRTKEEQTEAIKNAFTEGKVEDNMFLSYRTTKASLTTTKKKITIYYYRPRPTDEQHKGRPVVLNFTGTKKFLQCSRTDDGVHLSVVECEKDLESICISDQEMAFVFFMKEERSDVRTFESANCEGRFIEATSPRTVDAVDAVDKAASHYFSF
ncbi:uncharacterized protein LOC134071375 [Sardina pilchardus]|uniref:uncharacterized protein LOC134071375 n=1 Tax=Sardina pilchardus TaxID=27697 RepID=UPI002E1504E0